MLDNKLFYLSNSNFGGWVSFSYHLAKILGQKHVLKIKDTFRGGGPFYGDVSYKNIKKSVIHNFNNPIILAVDKAHYHLLEKFKEATIVIHDPTELSPEVMEFIKKNKVITIRVSVSKLLKEKGIENTFLKHPYYPYKKFLSKSKDKVRALSRVDFDKNTDIICRANGKGANIEIWGYKNHIYYFHKLKELGFDEWYKGAYSKELKDISNLYSETKYMVDLSTIKNDGGGTQYTFMDAEYHGCGLILHKKWCDVEGSIYKNGENCWAVETPDELLIALDKEPLISNVLPTKGDNIKWKNIQKHT